MTTQTPPKLEELLEEWRDIEADWYENISPPLSLAESYEAFIKKVYEAERDKYELRYCPHCNRMVNSQKATELFNAGYETGKPTEKNISQLRTWINEKPKDRLVTNEDIKMWLEM